MAENRSVIDQYVHRGLKGRKLFKPQKNKAESDKTFLLIYGQHISLERLAPMIEYLSNYGDVYLFDNPGFGNMESSYKIREKPTLDFYDGHLRQIFDELPKNRKVTVVAISFGFQLLTHFLQSHPSYCDRIKEVISFVGFVRYGTLKLPFYLNWLMKYILAGMGQFRIPSWFYYHIAFSPIILVPLFLFLSIFIKKLKGFNYKDRLKYAHEQAWLWKYNDPRTHAFTAWQFLNKTDLTNKKIPLHCYHVYAESDQYINHNEVLMDLNKIYSAVTAHTLDMPAHSPVDIDSEIKISKLIRQELLDTLIS